MGNSTYKGHSPSGKLVHAVNGHMPSTRLSEKRKLISHRPSPEYRDNLSKVRLTRSVLEEFNRRAAQLALDLRRSRPAKKLRRPLTRQHLAEVRANRLKNQSASEFLYNCDAKCLTKIKSFAKHGGPDLSGLRGVWYMLWDCSLLIPELTSHPSTTRLWIASGSTYQHSTILKTP
jgi:hypothetical protein